MEPIPIAIIGMSCRFAGDATDPEKLWKLSAEGGTAWSEVPASKFNLKGVYHPNGERAETVCPCRCAMSMPDGRHDRVEDHLLI